MKELSQYQRIAILGGASTGKSTLAKKISQQLLLPHIILDQHYWQSGWKRAPEKEFLQKVELLLGAKQWVCDGNYPIIQDILNQRVQCVIWLDYPLWRVILRFFKRSFRELILRKPNLTCCTDSFWRRFFSKESHLFWIVKSFSNRRNIYQKITKELEQSGIRVLHVQSLTQKKSLLK